VLFCHNEFLSSCFVLYNFNRFVYLNFHVCGTYTRIESGKQLYFFCAVPNNLHTFIYYCSEVVEKILMDGNKGFHLHQKRSQFFVLGWWIAYFTGIYMRRDKRRIFYEKQSSASITQLKNWEYFSFTDYVCLLHN
jgi:hypothetical protein